MIKELTDFKRKDLFKHYHSFDNPFLTITTKIDVTNIVEYCKTHKNFYGTLGYIITKTVNQIDEFKYRYKDNKIYLCNEINSNYVDILDDETIGYFDVEYTENFEDYLNTFKHNQKVFKENKMYSPENKINEIWLSCTPWFKFTCLTPPFNKEISIPQFIWDKYENINGKYYINLMIMVHHGFADGYHIGKFISILEENIKEFK